MNVECAVLHTPRIPMQGRNQRGAGRPCPPLVDWADFFTEKTALLGLFSLPEVFCGPQICQKCAGGSSRRSPRRSSRLGGDIPSPIPTPLGAFDASILAPSALNFCAPNVKSWLCPVPMRRLQHSQGYNKLLVMGLSWSQWDNASVAC